MRECYFCWVVQEKSFVTSEILFAMIQGGNNIQSYSIFKRFYGSSILFIALFVSFFKLTI